MPEYLSSSYSILPTAQYSLFRPSHYVTRHFYPDTINPVLKMAPYFIIDSWSPLKGMILQYLILDLEFRFPTCVSSSIYTKSHTLSSFHIS